MTALIVWRAVPATLKWAIAGAVVLFAAFWLGGSWERKDAAQRAAEGRVDNITAAQEIEADVESMDDATLGNELDGRLSAPRD